MPNLIEQQDLLKGLTDQRLAMLMQQPTATIPPFLVAAEAQRRQAIRSQFSGGPEKNESVVDSLTRQMAGAPQNVNANPPAPPAPPPQQMGIVGIQPQGMADGGPVRRYGDGGPIFTGRMGAQSIAGVPKPSDYGFLGYVGSGFNTLIENMQKYGLNPDAAQREELDASNRAAAEVADAEASGLSPEENIRELSVLSQRLAKPKATEAPPEKTEAPRDTNSGTAGTSLENKYKAQREGFRQRYEDLLSQSEPSSWERAQKWFDASQAFFQPNATTGEMVADAISAFGSGMAQEKAAARQADLNLQEALLNLDMEYAKEDREAEIAAANRAYERQIKLEDDAAKRKADLEAKRIPDASSAIRAYNDLIKSTEEELSGGPNGDQIVTPERKAELTRILQGYRNALSTIMSAGGFVASPTLEEMNAAINAGK